MEQKSKIVRKNTKTSTCLLEISLLRKFTLAKLPLAKITTFTVFNITQPNIQSVHTIYQNVYTYLYIKCSINFDIQMTILINIMSFNYCITVHNPIKPKRI